jgi:hypothetical protein
MFFRYAPFRTNLLAGGLFACGLPVAAALSAAQPSDPPTPSATFFPVAPAMPTTEGNEAP